MTPRPLPLLAAGLCCVPALAQAPAGTDTPAQPQPAGQQEPQTRERPQVTVSAFRLTQDSFELPRSVTVVDLDTLQVRDRDSVLDALDHKIGIWVEKRTATTSDPVIRGLSGGNVLALVDGDSLTTFWGEGGYAGDDMYGKVEAESIERVEVIRGPASVEYGSNALGGVINFITRKPRLDFTTSGTAFGGRLKAGYDSVNEGMMTRLDGELATEWLRFRVGGTWRDLDDGEGGGDVGKLVPSGGEDLNFDLNSEAKLGEGIFFWNAQRVRREDIMRYYRPTQQNANDRDAISLGYRSAGAAEGDGFEGRLYWQDKEDWRYFADGSIGRARWESYSTDWTWRTKRWEDHAVVAGLTARLDRGESPDDEQFTMYYPDGRVLAAAPDQDWYNLGAFVRDDWRLAPQWTLSGSLRFDRFYYDADPSADYQPTVGDPSIDDIDTWENSLTGGLGLAFAPAGEWRLFGSWTRGFRMFAPRFGVAQVGYGVLVPSGQLDPVDGDNYEFGVRYRDALLDCSAVAYHTDFSGFQNPVRGSYNGLDWYDINGNNVRESSEDVYVVSGNGDAWVRGIELEARIELHALCRTLPLGTYASGGFMWNEGEDETNDVPLRHTHPMRGLFALGFEEPLENRWQLEFGADMVDRYDDIDPARLTGDAGYRSDPQNSSSPLLRDYGLPGYTVFYLQGSAKLSDNARCGLHLDNLGDKNYRAAHSRMDAFGFNLGLWVEVTF
jgi:outer membrane receptor protein involved in Fe transport